MSAPHDPFAFPGGTASSVPRPAPDPEVIHIAQGRRACYDLGVCQRVDRVCANWGDCKRMNANLRAVDADIDAALAAHRRTRRIIMAKRIAIGMGVAILVVLACVGAGALTAVALR